jgi:hypothetical protein
MKEGWVYRGIDYDESPPGGGRGDEFELILIIQGLCGLYDMRMDMEMADGDDGVGQ